MSASIHNPILVHSIHHVSNLDNHLQYTPQTVVRSQNTNTEHLYLLLSKTLHLAMACGSFLQKSWRHCQHLSETIQREANALHLWYPVDKGQKQCHSWCSQKSSSICSLTRGPSLLKENLFSQNHCRTSTFFRCKLNQMMTISQLSKLSSTILNLNKYIHLTQHVQMAMFGITYPLFLTIPMFFSHTMTELLFWSQCILTFCRNYTSVTLAK